MGFGLTDLNLNFKKSFFELVQRYKVVESPALSPFCKSFLEKMSKGKGELFQAADLIMKNPESLFGDFELAGKGNKSEEGIKVEESEDQTEKHTEL